MGRPPPRPGARKPARVRGVNEQITRVSGARTKYVSAGVVVDTGAHPESVVNPAECTAHITVLRIPCILVASCDGICAII